MQGHKRYFLNVSGHIGDNLWRPSPAKKSYARACSCALVFLAVIFFSPLVSKRLHQISDILIAGNRRFQVPKMPPTETKFPLNCPSGNLTNKCPATYYPSSNWNPRDPDPLSPPSTCPEYFRWIHEDLRPWKDTGITKQMVEAVPWPSFRLVVIKGRAFMEMYKKCYQTRDVFSVWGILQLLRKYPGKIGDLDLMFGCRDLPEINNDTYGRPNQGSPPPVFHYCSRDRSFDIVFPDWSFWGWPEINVKPWEEMLKDLKEGNKKKRWSEREPYAYWKGNPYVAEKRKDILKCNVSNKHDWNARIYFQDWTKETLNNFKESSLASQCTHRYKIYIEGVAWSVSEKYILACDSLALLVKPGFYDFFTRSLVPLQHYWPLREDDKCRSIKFAVDWGNAHKLEAQAMGEAASNFMQQELKMENVYDYMFHLLNKYSSLLTYKPTIPAKAVEICPESMACQSEGREKEFLMKSMVKGPSNRAPCTMPPPYDPITLRDIANKKESSIQQVGMWEKEYWENQAIHV